MTAIFFLSGLFAGSFLNVVIHRVPRGESVVLPGSRCPACGSRLGPAELVPVLSYVWLKGRCRQCGAKISPRYPLVELLTGLLFAALFLRFGVSPSLLKYLVLACVLVVVTFTDIEHMLIPDKVIVFAVVSGAVLDLALGADPAAVLLGALIPAAFLYFLAVTTKGGVGGGDIKLAFATGLFFGVEQRLGPDGRVCSGRPGGNSFACQREKRQERRYGVRAVPGGGYAGIGTMGPGSGQLVLKQVGTERSRNPVRLIAAKSIRKKSGSLLSLITGDGGTYTDLAPFTMMLACIAICTLIEAHIEKHLSFIWLIIFSVFTIIPALLSFFTDSEKRE